jgi:hypothetical protein
MIRGGGALGGKNARCFGTFLGVDFFIPCNVLRNA